MMHARIVVCSSAPQYADCGADCQYRDVFHGISTSTADTWQCTATGRLHAAQLQARKQTPGWHMPCAHAAIDSTAEQGISISGVSSNTSKWASVAASQSQYLQGQCVLVCYVCVAFRVLCQSVTVCVCVRQVRHRGHWAIMYSSSSSGGGGGAAATATHALQCHIGRS